MFGNWGWFNKLWDTDDGILCNIKLQKARGENLRFNITRVIGFT